MILSVTAITTHHKKAERIGSDELQRFRIGHEISVNYEELSVKRWLPRRKKNASLVRDALKVIAMSRKKFLKIRQQIINRDAVTRVVKNSEGSVALFLQEGGEAIVFTKEDEADAVWREFNAVSEDLMEYYLDEDLAKKTLW